MVSGKQAGQQPGGLIQAKHSDHFHCFHASVFRKVLTLEIPPLFKLSFKDVYDVQCGKLKEEEPRVVGVQRRKMCALLEYVFLCSA